MARSGAASVRRPVRRLRRQGTALFSPAAPPDAAALRAVEASVEQALRVPVARHVAPTSDLLDPAAAEFFGRHLSLHHALAAEPLAATGFEALFVRTMRFQGRDARRAPTVNHRGYDVVVGGESFSLKTHSGRDTRRGTITITKLMESGGSALRNARDAAAMVSLVQSHLALYDRILVLQITDQLTALRETAAGDRAPAALVSELESQAEAVHQYELLEVPMALFGGLEQLRPSDFSRRAIRSGSTTAAVVRQGRPVMKLSFDGSDRKVRIRGIAVGDCVRHALWIVATPRS